MAAISKDVSTTTRGKNQKLGENSQHHWIVMSCSQKVSLHASLVSHSIPEADILEGYKEYKTERTYLARMGDWRDNKDVEIPLDGIGGVNIVVKAEVHRSGTFRAYISR